MADSGDPNPKDPAQGSGSEQAGPGPIPPAGLPPLELPLPRHAPGEAQLPPPPDAAVPVKRVGRKSTGELVESFATFPRFPRGELQTAIVALWRYFRCLPIKLQACIGVVLLVSFVAVALPLVLGEESRARFVSDLAPLRSGPRAGLVYPEIDILERGEPVELLDVVADYALVRDSSGQVGFLLERSLLAEVPSSAPDEPFTRCTMRRSESDTTSCLARSKSQADACVAYCQQTPDHPDCPQGCDERQQQCEAQCQQEQQEEAENRATTPKTKAVAAPPARSEPRARQVEAKPQGRKPKKKPRKKRRKKRKKRR